MSKRKRKKYTSTDKNVVFHMDSVEVFEVKKPRYNAYAIGHGVHGDTKYNRRKENREFKRSLNDW